MGCFVSGAVEKFRSMRVLARENEHFSGLFVSPFVVG